MDQKGDWRGNSTIDMPEADVTQTIPRLQGESSPVLQIVNWRHNEIEVCEGIMLTAILTNTDREMCGVMLVELTEPGAVHKFNMALQFVG